MKLLLIEDEVLLGRLIVSGLEAAHYQVEWRRDGQSGYDAAIETDYAVILLDLMLPLLDGWTICRRLRDRRNITPILMLTALDEIDERVRGLEMGADDYLPKPFDFSELKARVAALIRRNRIQRRRILRIADLEIDTDSQTVLRGTKTVALAPREYELLEMLASHEGQVVSREAIHALWRDTDIASNTLDVHIASLRRKIDIGRTDAMRLIQTVHRRGYLLRDPETQPS